MHCVSSFHFPTDRSVCVCLGEVECCLVELLVHVCGVFACAAIITVLSYIGLTGWVALCGYACGMTWECVVLNLIDLCVVGHRAEVCLMCCCRLWGAGY